MLDNLIESKSNLQNTKRRGGYLLTTSVLVFSMFASGILWSLFAKNLDIGSDGLELSTIVAPILPDDVPPPEPIKQTKQDNSPKTENNTFIRQDNIARTDEPIAPKEVSTSPTSVKARPNAPFTIGKEDADPQGSPSNFTREPVQNNSKIIVAKPNVAEKPDIEDAPPIITKKVEPKIDKKPPTQSLGVINGKAKSLPPPPYPAPARAVHAGGDVNVHVTIDEQGNVISAKAITGHALLRQAAENAARNAKFTPTLLSNQPVKVTGIIIYRFSAQ